MTDLPRDALLERLTSSDPRRAGASAMPSSSQMLALVRAPAAEDGTAPRGMSRWVATVAACGFLALTAATFFLGLGHDHHAASSAAETALVSDADFVNCGGILASVSSLSLPPGHAETGSTPEAAALRRALAPGHTVEGDPLPATGWILLAESATDVMFGHREGATGIGETVAVARSGGTFGSVNYGGCGSVVLANGRRSAPISSANSTGHTVTLTWFAGGLCSGVNPSTAQVQTAQTAQAVHVLLTIDPPPPRNTNRFCEMPAMRQTTTLTLNTPLGNRGLIDDSHVPPVTVDVK